MPFSIKSTGCDRPIREAGCGFAAGPAASRTGAGGAQELSLARAFLRADAAEHFFGHYQEFALRGEFRSSYSLSIFTGFKPRAKSPRFFLPMPDRITV